jgi:hypothetical protein
MPTGTGKHLVDEHGEAYFELEGTDSAFNNAGNDSRPERASIHNSCSSYRHEYWSKRAFRSITGGRIEVSHHWQRDIRLHHFPHI